jgi:DNA adenine methylase
MSADMIVAKELTQALKWHGGKGGHHGTLAKWILGLAPPHLHFCEPFAGGLATLLWKDPKDTSEVVNDLNGDVSNFWTVLQNRDYFDEFYRFAQVTPFSQVEFDDAMGALESQEGSPPERALWLLVACRQSLAGRTKDFSPLSRNRLRRGMNEQVSSWLTTVDGLPAVHERMMRVVVLNQDALQVIQSQDGPDTWQYLDPPYHPSTRTAPEVYRFEMTHAKHVELLSTAKSCKSKITISGYPCELYGKVLADWNRKQLGVKNSAAGGETKRTMQETIWMNF